MLENITGRCTYLHDQLVGSGDQGQAVGVVEGLRYVLAEGVPGPSGRDSPASAVVRVWPQQVTHRTLEEWAIINLHLITISMIVQCVLHIVTGRYLPNVFLSTDRIYNNVCEIWYLFEASTSWGTSCKRSSARIWSSVSMEGDSPPWRQKICTELH